MHGGLITRLSRRLNQASFEGAVRPERTLRRSRAIAQVAWAMHMDWGVDDEDKFGELVLLGSQTTQQFPSRLATSAENASV